MQNILPTTYNIFFLIFYTLSRGGGYRQLVMFFKKT